MAVIWAVLTLLFTIALLIWFNVRQKVNYWKRQNVELICLREFVAKLKLRHWGLVINEYYQEMRKTQKSFKAIEIPLISALIVQDQQAIQDIMVTYYESFPDRGLYVNHRDSLSTNIARLDYNLWKPMRHKLSPSFSPAKIKYMFPTVLEISERLVNVLKEQCKDSLQPQCEIYDLCARFTTDIMGQVIFGIESNTLREPRSEFRIQGDNAFKQLTNPLKDLLGSKFPKLLQLLNIKVFDKASNEFFTRIFKENMEFREKNNIRRQDFMDILIELKRESESNGDFSLTVEMLVGQVFALFVGGFETTSCTMTYALYEMAKHQEIQEKARKEVADVIAKYDHKFTYESLKNMKYVNQIILETLRKYPIIPNMSRLCRRSCSLQTSSGPVTIIPGTTVIIPFYAIQRNPNYYPEPEEFRPERFTEIEISKRPPCTFMAFGAGPKTCIGESFGKMPIRMGLAALLSQFRFSFCEKTPKELAFDPKNMFVLFVKGGIYLKVEKL